MNQERSDKFFGLYLLERGVITTEALREVLGVQTLINLPLGRLAVTTHMLTEDQVTWILREQRKSDRRFGEIAFERGWLTPTQLDELWRVQTMKWVFLGDALVGRGHLTPDQLQRHLAEYTAAQQVDRARIEGALDLVQGGAVLRTFLEMTVKTCLRTGGLAIKVTEVADRQVDDLDCRHLVTQRVRSSTDMTFGLLLPDQVVLAVASAMLGSPQPAIGELALDAAGEFLNVIVGHVCAKLSAEWTNLRVETPAIRTVDARTLDWPGQTWIGLASAEAGRARPFHILHARGPVPVGAGT